MTPLPFMCVHTFLSGHRHLLRNVMHCGRLRLRVLFSTLLSCIARGWPFPRFLKFADQSFFLGEDFERLLFSLAIHRLLNEVSSLFVAVHSLSAECGRL